MIRSKTEKQDIIYYPLFKAVTKLSKQWDTLKKIKRMKCWEPKDKTFTHLLITEYFIMFQKETIMDSWKLESISKQPKCETESSSGVIRMMMRVASGQNPRNQCLY